MLQKWFHVTLLSSHLLFFLPANYSSTNVVFHTFVFLQLQLLCCRFYYRNLVWQIKTNIPVIRCHTKWWYTIHTSLNFPLTPIKSDHRIIDIPIKTPPCPKKALNRVNKTRTGKQCLMINYKKYNVGPAWNIPVILASGVGREQLIAH